MHTTQQAFDSAYASRAPLFGEEAARLVSTSAALLNPGAQVLDLGCGDGRNSLFLLEGGFQVRAIDFADSGIDYLQAKAEEQGVAEGLTTEVVDIRDVELRREEFDAIIAITVLENLTKQEQLVLMDRLRLACRAGGIMTIESHSDRDPAVNGSDERVTEFGKTIVGPMRRNELLGYFRSWRILHYHDILFEDTTHGAAHNHGRVGVIAQNTNEFSTCQ